MQDIQMDQFLSNLFDDGLLLRFVASRSKKVLEREDLLFDLQFRGQHVGVFEHEVAKAKILWNLTQVL